MASKIEDRAVLEAHLAEANAWLEALASMPKHDDWLERVLGWFQHLFSRRH